MFIRPAIVISTLLYACGGKDADCADLDGASDREWCMVGVAVEQADSGALDDSLATLATIEDRGIRAAGARRVLPRARSLPLHQVEQLCQDLGPGLDSDCSRAWARAHLWEADGDPAAL